MYESGRRMAKFLPMRANDELALLNRPMGGRVLGQPSEDMRCTDEGHRILRSIPGKKTMRLDISFV